MTKLTQQEAAAKIATLTNAAHELVREAEVLADEHGLEFDFDLAYGMGGTYYGEGHEYVTGSRSWAEQGWNPSSMSC